MHVKARLAGVGLVAALSLTVPVLPTPASAATPSDPAVITEWNAIATRTIYTENATPVPVSPLYFGFVHLAMYDAVVAVEGGYQPYIDIGPAGRSGLFASASSEVAAATAAYDVLRHYFPASAANLRSDYLAFLDELPAGKARALGQRVGRLAALHLIRARDDDGRNASVSFTVAPAPGVWRPTPPGNAAFLVPWLGLVDPLLLDSSTQIPLPGPDPIDSAAYAIDFAEVKAKGSSTGSTRTPAETQNAVFFSDNIGRQSHVGMRDQMTRRGLDIVESARAFALLSSTQADALISTWRSKFDYAYWRPITAIRLADTDGNAATVADPAWTPMMATPPYPDYVSGHAPFSGATSGTLAYLFGADSIDLNLSSALAGSGTSPRNFATADALDEATKDARIHLGFHFRKAMTDGNDLGHAVVDYATDNYFQPLN